MATQLSISDLARAVTDAFYVSVGAGVLAAQRAQVRRRELEARVEVALDDVERNLPEPLSSTLRRGRQVLRPVDIDTTPA